MAFGDAVTILRAMSEALPQPPPRAPRPTWRGRPGRRSLAAIASLAAAALALSAGCIESNRARGVADDAPAADGAAMDTATADDDATTTCGRDAPCPQPGAACLAADCVDGACVERSRTGEACDDANACTGFGSCDASGRCVPGAARPEGSECAPATVCAAASTCDGAGTCEPGGTTCPEPDRPCGVAVCDVAAGGCVVVPAADGSPCGDDDDAWVCSGGACVPEGMVFVPSGVFTMGCDDPFCPADQRPSHGVSLSGFAVDLREVTNGDYAACVADTDAGSLRCPARAAAPGDVGGAVVADAPELAAAHLTWAAAQAVCGYYGKRLCTEAEWEKAARGADGRRFPWGSGPQPSCERVIMSEDASGRGCGLGHQAAPGTRPLGASPYGLLDASGNVAEWVSDYYHPDAYQQRDPDGATVDPVLTEPHLTYPLTRVLRGGAWEDTAAPNLRATARRPQLVEALDDAAGVRCCFTPNDDDDDGDGD